VLTGKVEGKAQPVRKKNRGLLASQVKAARKNPAEEVFWEKKGGGKHAPPTPTKNQKPPPNPTQKPKKPKKKKKKTQKKKHKNTKKKKKKKQHKKQKRGKRLVGEGYPGTGPNPKKTPVQNGDSEKTSKTCEQERGRVYSGQGTIVNAERSRMFLYRMTEQGTARIERPATRIVTPREGRALARGNGGF